MSVLNLFGLPAVGNVVKGKIVLSPQELYFAEYRDYFFTDPHKPVKVFEENLTALKTDAEGNVDFPLHLERFSQSSYCLHFLTEGFEDESGLAVSAEMSALVTPANYLVGYKPDSDLHYVRKGERMACILSP